jgi:hypothetical protein
MVTYVNQLFSNSSISSPSEQYRSILKQFCKELFERAEYKHDVDAQILLGILKLQSKSNTLLCYENERERDMQIVTVLDDFLIHHSLLSLSLSCMYVCVCVFLTISSITRHSLFTWRRKPEGGTYLVRKSCKERTCICTICGRNHSFNRNHTLHFSRRRDWESFCI